MRSILIKAITLILILMIAISGFILSERNDFLKQKEQSEKEQAEEGHAITDEARERWEEEGIEIESLLSGNDEDADGIDDFEDIIQGARADALNMSEYRDAYYRGGYPPENEGVCTDVIWRAFRNAGFELKDLIDKDIKSYTDEYKRVVESGGPDPNIDFRRIPNLVVYFDKYAKNLTNEIKSGDVENLYEWQGGDIVVFGGRIKHIGIVSDKRNKQGIPYLIHNAGPYTVEADSLIYWDGISEIARHYRWIAE